MTSPPPPGPGPLLHHFNRVLHAPPISFIFYGLYWAFILIVASPVAGCFQLSLTALQCVRFALLLPFGKAGGSRIEPRELEGRYAAMITGCDSGFGSDLGSELARRGFFVFAGCLQFDSMRQFDGSDKIVPLKMDVTNQEEVDAASEAVRKWMSDAEPGSPRYLHALVNNAGVGTGGLVDWLDVSDFKRDMEVNYFGMIRVVKAFLPIIKSQTHAGVYMNSRIINIVSVAGLQAGGVSSSYHGSKFAAEAFSTCLRHEMRAFGVSVVTVNPTFHQTPLVDGMGVHLRKKWQGLNSKLRKEYGDDFFEEFSANAVHSAARVTWKAHIVLDQLVSCVEQSSPPRQCVVGIDGKYSFLLMRHLPVWAQDLLMTCFLSPKVKPALMAGGK